MFTAIIGTQAYFFSDSNASTLQGVDVFSAFVHKATYEPIVAEDDAGHLGDVLMALAFCDVGAVVHQAGHQIAFPPLLICTLFQLRNRFKALFITREKKQSRINAADMKKFTFLI